MKTFEQLRRGNKIYSYSEEGNMSFENIVERIDTNPFYKDSIYINGCCFDRKKVLMTIANQITKDVECSMLQINPYLNQ